MLHKTHIKKLKAFAPFILSLQKSKELDILQIVMDFSQNPFNNKKYILDTCRL
jgi:hypothetical protein